MRSNHRCHSKLVRAGSTSTFLPQCTFWCRVLTDTVEQLRRMPRREVSMHLLVPGAYRPTQWQLQKLAEAASQCTFWCRVLTNFADSDTGSLAQASQCTFWCRALTDSAIGIVSTLLK